jgi:hypothetical protein
VFIFCWSYAYIDHNEIVAFGISGEVLVPEEHNGQAIQSLLSILFCFGLCLGRLLPVLILGQVLL